MPPRVLCICPAHLPAFKERIEACFHSQTYENKVWAYWNTVGMKWTVGKLRNMLIDAAVDKSFDIIAHFDQDDWSAPTRLAEQVAFMQRNGAQVVGYGDMPFYDIDRDKVLFYDSRNPRYALGTSLLYRREVWEKHPFPDATPEDTVWQNGLPKGSVLSESSVQPSVTFTPMNVPLTKPMRLMMVQTIHKGNASPKRGARFQPASPEIEAAVRKVLASQAALVAQ